MPRNPQPRSPFGPPGGPPPRSTLRGIPARLGGSVLVKITWPLVVGLGVGSLVTATIVGRGRGGGHVWYLDLLALVGILLSAAGTLIWLTARSVTRPLATLSKTARQVAAGNLDAHFAHTSNDEIGQLAFSLETMRREVSSQLDLISRQADALRESSKRITSARDEERRRLARDMHDGLQQQLVMLRIGMGMAAEKVKRDPDAATTIFNDLGRELERVLERVREVSHDLYPSILRDRGLTSAVRSQASKLPISARLTSTPDPLPRLAREIESSAYFVLSEALANILKHAGATEVAVGLVLDETALILTVSDNGRGLQEPIEPDRASSGGVTNMNDRIRSLGGDLSLASGASGTVIRATFPLDSGEVLFPDSPQGPSAGALPGRAAPRRVRAEAAGTFAGRAREAALLHEAFDQAALGQGRLVLLVGEAGIGKTWVANELGTYASSLGADVLVGRCYEGEGAPAYWPWIQVIRSFMRRHPPVEVAAALGPGVFDLAQIVPELAEAPELAGARPTDQAPGLAAGRDAGLDTSRARFRLFDSVSSLLRYAARTRPLVVIVDDLQWADTPSLQLLEFLADELAGSPILVLGTHRRVSLPSSRPLGKTLATLALHDQVETIALGGIDAEDVGRFIAAATGAKPPEELVSAVFRQTEGNPLFVREVVRLLASEGRLEQGTRAIAWDVEIPVTVREAIGRRLEHLSPECLRILSVASSIGREFDLAVLQRVAAVSPEPMGLALDEALAEGILIRLAGAVPHAVTLRFTHALIYEIVYAGLNRPERTRLHRRAAEALEANHAEDLDPHLADLARHYLASGQRRDRAKAIHYSTLAGDRAASLLAYEEAASHYQRALRAVGGPGRRRAEPRRCDLLLALGESQWRAGDTQAARESFLQAARVARRLLSPHRLAQAALGYGEGLGAFEFKAHADKVLVGLLEESLFALERWPPQVRVGIGNPVAEQGHLASARLRVRLLARLAVELYNTNQAERRFALGEEAVALAQRLGDPVSQLVALYSRSRSVLGPDTTEERLNVAEEIVRLARQVADQEMELRGLRLRLLTRLERGDRPGMDADLQAWLELAGDPRQPLDRWQLMSLKAEIALMEGDFAQGEALARAAFTTGRGLEGERAAIRFNAQIFIHQWGRGRLAGAEAAALEVIRRYHWLPAWRAGICLVYVEMDRRAEAAAAFEALIGTDFAEHPRDGTWLGTVALACVACAYLDDTARAPLLYDLLAPYRQRSVVSYSGGFCLGSASTFLAMMAATLGRYDEAHRLFQEGLVRNQSLGALPMTALTLTHHAAMLLRRNDAEDVQAAVRMLRQAGELAERLQLAAIGDQVAQLSVKAEILTGARPAPG